MALFPVVCTFTVVKMTSSENSQVPERSQAYIFRKQGLKMSQIIEFLNILKNRVMKWSVLGENGEFSEVVFT